MKKKIAVIEDSVDVNNAIAGFCQSLGRDYEVDQFYDRESAEDAIKAFNYSLIVLDIDLPPEKNAGIGIIYTNVNSYKSPIMVVSGLDKSFYKNVMKQLDVWDYMEKPIPADGQDFIESALRILRAKSNVPSATSIETVTTDNPTGKISFKGKRLNLPETAKLILKRTYERKGNFVPYEEYYELVKSGKNPVAIRQHVKNIRDALIDINENPDHIVVIRMKGIQWQD
ncbi:response regulator transcription factor [Pseudomonas avellanae]|uniref:response regulator transcription factor n=1 Tax=Pseudomonas avellanae TaxID=46257 RepID=UPI000463E738|nr:response regulator [Pseudomonas avellanae]